MKKRYSKVYCCFIKYDDSIMNSTEAFFDIGEFIGEFEGNE